jgi:hypothetical protein
MSGPGPYLKKLPLELQAPKSKREAETDVLLEG